LNSVFSLEKKENLQKGKQNLYIQNTNGNGQSHGIPFFIKNSGHLSGVGNILQISAYVQLPTLSTHGISTVNGPTFFIILSDTY
jgi:hypothetical protein